MRLSNELVKEINSLISSMINLGLCDDQNFCTQHSTGDTEEVAFAGSEHVAIALKDFEYSVIYHELLNKRSFSMKLIDGGLVQMMYRIKGGSLQQHRLAYLPSPDRLPFNAEAEIYLQDEMYLEIVARRIVPFPIRFDFDSRPDVHVEVHHPVCHLTLGDVKNCRIPVSSALTPRWFLEFVLRNFYQTPELDLIANMPTHSIPFSPTITQNELSVIHVVVPN